MEEDEQMITEKKTQFRCQNSESNIDRMIDYIIVGPEISLAQRERVIADRRRAKIE